MSIKSELQQWGSELISKTGNFTGQLTQTFQNFVSEAGATIAGIYPGDVVGMNVANIESMKREVQTYVKGIETALDTIKGDTETELAAAFANSDMKIAVEGFLDAVMTACKAYTSQLLKFYDLLDSVSKQYTAQQEAMNKALNGEAKTTAESITRYEVGNQADATPAA